MFYEMSMPFRRLVMRSSTAFVVILVAVCVWVVPAGSALKTTEPGAAEYRVKVVFTDKLIAIKGKKFHGVTLYPRGSVIEFVLRNKGKLPHDVRLKLVTQHYFKSNEKNQPVILAGKRPIQPGAARYFAINFYFRGQFALQIIDAKKVLASTPITIN
jgi:hypothetical protein